MIIRPEKAPSATLLGFLNEDQLKRLRRLRWPAWIGVSRQTSPVSRNWGAERGTPVGRWYEQRFLDAHVGDIRGCLLEIRDKRYSAQHPNITRIDVLDIDPNVPGVTIVGDLSDMPHVPSDTYDCAIVTRVFQYMRDVPAAIRELYRVLCPGGVLLSVHNGVPGRLTQLDCEGEFEREFLTLSPHGTRTLFEEVFGPNNVTVEEWGNVIACLAFLRGVAAEEVGERRLLVKDPYFPQTITVRATKGTTL